MDDHDVGHPEDTLTIVVAAPGEPVPPPGALPDVPSAIRAAEQLRRVQPSNPLRVEIPAGDFYLAEPLRLGPALAGSAGAPTVIAGVNGPGSDGAGTRLLAGRRIHPEWSVADAHGTVMARIDGLAFDQLYVDGRRQIRARYPNVSTNMRVFESVADDAVDRERVTDWTDPRGAVLHAKHENLWGDMFVGVIGCDPGGNLLFGPATGNNRPSPPHRQERYVENVFEELDAPGEWFLDRESRLFYRPEAGSDLAVATFEVSGAMRVIEIVGSPSAPVHDVRIENLVVGHAAMSFPVATEPMLRSDAMVAREGAIVLSGCRDVSIVRCEVSDTGGAGILLDGFNQGVDVRGCHVHAVGGSAVNVFGRSTAVRSPMFSYDSTVPIGELDRRPGPKSDEHPDACVIDDNLIHDVGTVELGSAGVSIAMSHAITVSSNTIYRSPRAGINICDGTWGGHVIEHNDVFDTVLETADHGAFNSWGRDRFWDADPDELARRVAEAPELTSVDNDSPTILRFNRFHCENGWDIDLDDGSSHYRIHHNVLLHGGLKMREGYNRRAWNNILLNNGLHPHLWAGDRGDHFERNIVGAAPQPIRSRIAGDSIDHNFFLNERALDDSRRLGLDAASGWGQPQFLDPVSGDFRVAVGSPALAFGFENFDMDRFGVRSPGLRGLADAAPRPAPMEGVVVDEIESVDLPELGDAVVRTVISAAEMSAHGLGVAEGVAVLDVTLSTRGLSAGDVILAFAGGDHEDEQPVIDVDHLRKLLRFRSWRTDHRMVVWRNQQRLTVLVGRGPDEAE